MTLKKLTLPIVLFSSVITFGCRTSENSKASPASPHQLTSPAVSESQTPNLLAATDGNIYLSWIEALGENRHALKFSRLEENGWSEARMIAQGNNWLVNWADFPSLAVINNGALVAHWLARSGEEKYAYNVNIAFSTDGGDSWSAPMVPHTDGTPTEHGFVSLLPWEKDRVLAVWLDGRNFDHNVVEAEKKEVMTLRAALLEAEGNLSNEVELDNRVCDCCQTGAGLTTKGALVAYRDRTEKEIRDISIVRLENGKWSQPEILFSDDWEINGCPVNGPAVATQGDKVAIAWYTEANNTSKVKIIFSRDGGKTFGQPFRVDDGDPMGRIAAVLLANGEALVCWMEARGSNAEVRIRRIQNDGKAGKSITVTPTSATRASGFPRMVLNGEDVVFAWTKSSAERSIHTAKMNLRALE